MSGVIDGHGGRFDYREQQNEQLIKHTHKNQNTKKYKPGGRLECILKRLDLYSV